MIVDNLNQIRSTLPPTVKLVAVSKFQPLEKLLEAYNGGQRIFGESRVQELVEKEEALPKDIEWHFIGHLQKNKVKHIVPFISLIHGVDSIGLLAEINKCAAKEEKPVEVLIQVHIAEEESKFGFSEEECFTLFANKQYADCPHVKIKGLMGMATFTDNMEQVRREFQTLHTLFTRINGLSEQPLLKELSMGMSDDYPLAIAEGSTMVRIGSKLFGNR